MADGVGLQETGESRTKPYQLSSWGDLKISVSGEDCTPRSRKARALVAFLASHPGKVFRRERIAELLWSDRGEEQARASLRQVLVALKPFADRHPPLLHADRDHLSFDGARLATRIDELSAIADAGDSEAFDRALPGFMDRYFADLDHVSDSFDDWLARERSLRTDQLSILVQRAASRARQNNDSSQARRFETWLRSFDAAWDGQLPDVVPVAAAPQPLPRSREPKRRMDPRAVGALVATVVTVALATTLLLFVQGNAPMRSIAVLPFDSTPANSDPYLADGISEEIMTRLAQNPNQRVVGRTSAWSFRGQSLDAQEIGRRLGVEYLVEGSLQSDKSQLRVDVSLILVRDGTRLWTQRLAGGRNDVFAIQDRIGQAISSRIGTPVGEPLEPQINGAAHMLVMTSRGLLLSRDPAKFDAALILLRQATALDPNYAEGWAMTARALLYRARDLPDSATDPAIDPEVMPDLRRALAIDPRLAQAHMVLGMVPSPPERRRAELTKAIELDRSDPESWFALSRLDRFDGQFGREYDDLKQAFLLDPLWKRASFGVAESAWDLGQFRESDAFSIKTEKGLGAGSLEGQLYEVDRRRRRGDYSGSAAAAQAAGLAEPTASMFFRDLLLAWAYRAAGGYERARSLWAFYKVDPLMWRMWHNEPPTSAEFEAILRDPVRGVGQEERTSFILATLLNARRNVDVTRLFAVRYGSAAGMANSNSLSNAAFVRQATLYAMALRASGHAHVAGQLVKLADDAVRRVTTSSIVPSWYYALAAQLWAAEGRTDAAVNALARADSLRWRYECERDSFPDIAMEPAFAALRGNQRFETLRAKWNEHVRRERDEMDVGRALPVASR